MSNTTQERHEFQAEVRQVLDIVVHSLYTDKEIFVRELVSNASDALEKLRHTQLTEEAVLDANLPLEINLTTDDTAATLTIQDHGIGMTRDDLVENLGTIAHSGSKAFLKALKEKGSGNDNLIGQFGVGFYSAFMVAEEVKVYARSWHPESKGWLWTCDGNSSYTIEETEGLRRGVKIVIRLKEDCKEFASASRIKAILERYSSFIEFPISLNGDKINTTQAVWLKSKGDIKEEEYKEFYKFQAKAFDEPMDWMHFSADAPLTIHALLFIPGSNPEAMGFGRIDPGVALHCRKVLIDPQPKKLLPEWLRFLKGVIDSADLPLNISRESMQDSALLQKLNAVITKRFIKHLETMAKKEGDKYQRFWKTFGVYIKEGVTMDFAHRENLSSLLRFESSWTEPGKLTSLQEYVDRMKEEQKEIYFLSGPQRKAIEQGPYLEAFKARGLEVLYCFEPIDEFVMSHLNQFKEKSLISADTDGLELPGEAQQTAGEPLPEKEAAGLCDWLKSTLGEKRVTGVEVGNRLVDSPAVALNADKFMTAGMRRFMQAMQREEQEGEETLSPVKLQINPRHPLVKKLASIRENNEETATLVAEQIFDNALISAGMLADPRAMVGRLHTLLERIG